ALADARTAGRIFFALRERARSLPDTQRRQLAYLLSLHDAPLAGVIGQPGDNEAMPAGGLTVRPAPQLPRLDPIDPAEPIEVSAMEAAFDAAPRVITGFEHRPQQRTMADTVREAFDDGGHVLVEAGTGVG